MRNKFVIIFMGLVFGNVNFCHGEELTPETAIYKGAISIAYDTAQGYVSIKVVNMNDQTSKNLCVLSPILLSALAKEYDLPYGNKKLKEIALSNNERVFYFQKPEAIEEFKLVKYTPEELSLVRQRLAQYSDNALAVGFGATRKYDKERNIKRLHSLYTPGGDAPPGRYLAYRDAIGCVLTERNIPSIASQCTGTLWIPSNEPDD